MFGPARINLNEISKIAPASAFTREVISLIKMISVDFDFSILWFLITISSFSSNIQGNLLLCEVGNLVTKKPPGASDFFFLSPSSKNECGESWSGSFVNISCLRGLCKRYGLDVPKSLTAEDISFLKNSTIIHSVNSVFRLDLRWHLQTNQAWF